MGRPEISRSYTKHLGRVGSVRIYESPPAGVDELIDRLRGASTILPFFAGSPLTREVLQAVRPSLVVIAGPIGACVDQRAAWDIGARVYDTPGLSALAVADYSFALLLALAHRIHEGAFSVRTGGWGAFVGRELTALKLGIVGLGRVGTRVAEMASVFGMEVSAWSPRLDRGGATPEGVRGMSLRDLLSWSDAVSLHLRLSPQTKGIIGASEIKLMSENALLVNTARAALLDMAAIRAAVAAGRLGGVALDVHDVEPLPKADILRCHPLVLCTPHMAWMTEQTIDRFVTAVASFVEHESPISIRQVV
ncbi:NAD(P)-dependent oxidoreductase [Streptomyces sp. NPDC001127]|uniref:NAD(P)-dependent oxidoreductase n=1 Tax=Streptomyces sp. NPDC001127 TaxID=3154377 RepID=UPI00332903B7